MLRPDSSPQSHTCGDNAATNSYVDVSTGHSYRRTVLDTHCHHCGCIQHDDRTERFDRIVSSSSNPYQLDFTEHLETTCSVAGVIMPGKPIGK